MPRNWLRSVLLLTVVSILIAVVVWAVSQRVPLSERMKQARENLAARRFEQAKTAAEAAIEVDPAHHGALLIAGEAASQLNDDSAAVHWLESIPASSPQFTRAQELLGDLLLKHPSAAAAHYRRWLRHDPLNVVANHRLSYLLGLAGRNWEAIPCRLRLIKARQIEPITLYLLCTSDTLLENSEELTDLLATAPDDPLVLMGSARQEIDRQHDTRAWELLRQVLQQEPEMIEAHLQMGNLLRQKGSFATLSEWHAKLPAAVVEHPGYWMLLGTAAQQDGQVPVAIRCYWEALKLDPSRQQACYQLSQLLRDTTDSEAAAVLLERSRLLERYFTAVSAGWSGTDMAAVRQAAELAEKLGMLWEAYGWSQLMLDHQPRTAWAQTLVQRLQRRLPDLPLERTLASTNPALTVDLSHYPLPQWSTTPQPTGETSPSPAESEFRFTALAGSSAPQFTYFNGAPRDQQTRRMYEFNGGGVAALDYDLDGWPDLYFTQGARFPAGQTASEYSDQLCRNQGSFGSVDVTTEAGVADRSFSSGVTVGDFNNDGFPDLYVANIGANRFLMNHGDGTFDEVTEQTGTAGNDWSTSCVLADVDGDSLPDLYVVNYLSGDDVFQRVCPEPKGTLRSCSPRQFPAAQDRLYLNVGNGTFEEITAASGIVVPDGKGLGIVAMKRRDGPGLDLFIANDAVPNFLFQHAADSSPGRPRFLEQALVSGLALNALGLPEACMGVAAGDANGDGLLDLLVTNFYNETNTLYQQLPDRTFVDSTAASRLAAPSLKQLGFGTQFLDINADGDLDLIVTNGHIDDLSDTGINYEMLTQIFRNDGTGKFSDVNASELGTFFLRPHLGRGLARVDWNRDGRDDVAISHLHEPATLLLNETRSDFHTLNLQLRGRDSSRDAIGAIVEVPGEDRTLVHQLTAGDGFQASNERRLIIGVGSRTEVPVVIIRWPAGLVQEFHHVPVDRDVMLLESQTAFHVIGGDDR